MSGLHATLGWIVLATNAAAAIWGGIAWIRRAPSVWFWYLLRVAQAAVAVQVALGLGLLFSDRRPSDDLHILYGLSPLLITLASEGMRVGAAQRELDEVDDVDALSPEEQRAVARRVVLREMGVMTVGTLLIVTLSLRALELGA